MSFTEQCDRSAVGAQATAIPRVARRLVALARATHGYFIDRSAVADSADRSAVADSADRSAVADGSERNAVAD